MAEPSTKQKSGFGGTIPPLSRRAEAQWRKCCWVQCFQSSRSLSTYCVPGPVLGAGDTAVTQTLQQSPLSQSLQSKGGDRRVPKGDQSRNGTHRQLWESRGGLGRRINQGRLPGGGDAKAEIQRMGTADGTTKPAEHRPRTQAESFGAPQAPLTPNFTNSSPTPTAIPDKHTQNRHHENIRSIPAYYASIYMQELYPAVSNRTSHDDENALYLQCPKQ